MKNTILLVLGVFVISVASWAATPPQTAQEVYLEKMLRFYAKQDIVENKEIVTKAVMYTYEAASLLSLTAQVDTLLSMWHRESTYNPAATDPGGDSVGICQTQPKDSVHWRKFWHRRGIKLGPFTDVRTQIFFGVAAFNQKLKDAHGNVKEAVRRYNGAGPMAQLYARRVLWSRKLIFGRGYNHKKGERLQPA